LSSILLFGWSAFYHIGSWSVARKAFMRRIDHANIFVLIAGTYTPIVFNVLTGTWRIGILAVIWTLAVVGVATAAPAVHLPRWITATLYVVMGWVVIAALPQILAKVGIQGVLLLLLAGILYTLGAIAYALRKPTLWSRVFSFHEVFHLATILANGAFFTFMVLYVVPFVRK
jgi:hemolysin III